MRKVQNNILYIILKIDNKPFRFYFKKKILCLLGPYLCSFRSSLYTLYNIHLFLWHKLSTYINFTDSNNCYPGFSKQSFKYLQLKYRNLSCKQQRNAVNLFCWTKSLKLSQTNYCLQIIQQMSSLCCTKSGSEKYFPFWKSVSSFSGISFISAKFHPFQLDIFELNQ